MKLTILVVGKTGKKELQFLIDEYSKRLGKYLKHDWMVIDVPKNYSKYPIDEQKRLEGELILKKLDNRDFVMLCDEKGKLFSSKLLADFMDKTIQMGTKNLVMVIGGAYGFSEDVYQRGNAKLSFSKMTFSHQMVRLILIEQVYRAFAILNNHPYHHE